MDNVLPREVFDILKADGYVHEIHKHDYGYVVCFDTEDNYLDIKHLFQGKNKYHILTDTKVIKCKTDKDLLEAVKSIIGYMILPEGYNEE